MPIAGVLKGALVFSNIIALLTLGFNMNFITTRILNVAQATFAVVGSYSALGLLYIFGIHPYLSLPMVFLIGGLVGILSYLLLRPLILKKASIIILIISTMALDLILIGVIGAGSDTLATLTGRSTSKFVFSPWDFSWWGTSGILIISFLVIGALSTSLYLLLYKTKFGIALRASMENPDLAESMGIKLEKIRLFSWFISGALAGIAGALLPFRQEITVGVGSVIIIPIIAASVVGGLRSIRGAFIGAYLIGISESLVIYVLSEFFGSGMLVYGRTVALAALVLALILAPRGLGRLNWRTLITKLVKR